MPKSIPYDPSLVLGQIVQPEALARLTAIGAENAKVDAAEHHLNTLITLKRKLSMTVTEMFEMGVNPIGLKDEIKKTEVEMVKAAEAYAKIAAEVLPKIQAIESEGNLIGVELESPIDYNRSQFRKLALASDTLELDSQYFAWDKSGESSGSAMSQFKAFSSKKRKIFGGTRTKSHTQTATSQVQSQLSNHNVDGTLVISAVCTHKSVNMFSPFVLNVDKAVRLWNRVYPDDKLNPTDGQSMQETVLEEFDSTEEDDEKKGISLLSGAAYGSSFTGMVHVLKSKHTSSYQSMTSTASSIQRTFDINLWFYRASGGSGGSGMGSTSVRSMLSQMSVSSHVSLIVSGVIPTIKANEVAIYSQRFADSPAQQMDKLAQLANSNASEMASVNQSANAAREGKRMKDLQVGQTASMVSALADGDKEKNKILDINTMMTAFDDYINKAIGGELGVPIQFYIKNITKGEIANMWVAKYLPDRFITMTGDNEEAAEGDADDDGGDDDDDDN